MKTEFAPFDISDHLDNEEVIAEYLTVAAEDEDPNILLAALGDVAKARGMARVAADAGLGRESIYKALKPGAHPRFETIQAIVRALNLRVVVQPAGRPFSFREGQEFEDDNALAEIEALAEMKETLEVINKVLSEMYFRCRSFVRRAGKGEHR
jgi:probable addiction module antidote protein